MTATQKLIEDAIAGGWKPDQDSVVKQDGVFVQYIGNSGKWVTCEVERMLLDPSFWQAVGKTRGWGDVGDYPDIVYEAWDTFFYQLYNGETTEEAIGKLN